MLSAYDLLTNGDVPEGTYNQDHINGLLSQARILGNKLKPQFDTPSGLPATFLNFTTNELVNAQSVNPLDGKTYNSTNTAIAGTIILEFHRLSDLTGDESFRILVRTPLFTKIEPHSQLLSQADRGESWLVNPHPAPIYPGLVGSQLDIETGNYLTFDFGWNSGIDSFFEVSTGIFWNRESF
jgi:mannosyl-oligosaccharide alpha-1,2-mannosidase